MSNIKKSNDNPKLAEKYSTRQAVLSYYLVLMFTVFPLFASNAYFNIRHDKYYFFIALSGVVIIAEAVLLYFAYYGNKKDSPPEMTVSDSSAFLKFSSPPTHAIVHLTWKGHASAVSGCR